MSDSFVS